MIEDYDVIVASMMKQYGVRMYSAEFRQMKWEEFRSLLIGLGADTPLGNLVQIRSETDPKILEHFTSAQKRVRDEWIGKHSRVNTTAADHQQFLAQMQNYFSSLGGET